MKQHSFLNAYGAYSNSYSDSGFVKKGRKHAAAIGRALIEKALTLYYALNDPDTPLWAKTAIMSALGYLICPIDAIPDFIPVAGYTDDAGVIIAALGLVSAHIQDKHRRRAREKVEEWLG